MNKRRRFKAKRHRAARRIYIETHPRFWFNPYRDNQIQLFDGQKWELRAIEHVGE